MAGRKVPVGLESLAEALVPGGVELLISSLLRSGVLLSLTLLLAGMGLSFLHHPEYFDSRSSLSQLLSPPHGPRTMEAVLASARDVRGQAFVMLGLLVMMAVPVVRVIIALLAFRQQRDRTFVRLTATVLTLLAVSVLLGKATH